MFKKSLIAMVATMSLSAFANSMPEAIYVPENAVMVSADKAWIGDGFDYEANVSGTTIAELSAKIIQFYTDAGFVTVENKHDADDAEFVFTRGQERVEIDLDLDDNGVIEYEVDYNR